MGEPIRVGPDCPHGDYGTFCSLCRENETRDVRHHRMPLSATPEDVVQFILDRTPTICISGDNVTLRFSDFPEAMEWFTLLRYTMDSRRDAKRAVT